MQHVGVYHAFMLAAFVQCTKRDGGKPAEEQAAWQTALASKVGDLKPIDVDQVLLCLAH